MSRRVAVLAMFCLLAAGGLFLWLNTTPKPLGSGVDSSAAPVYATQETKVASAPAKDNGRSQANLSGPVTSALPLAALGSRSSAEPRVAAVPVKTELPPADPDPSGLTPETVLENTRSVFRQYASRFGGNPVGTNPEITAALNGGNPKQVNFLKPEDGLRINSRGELIDSWGTPYFFHQLSANEMEIHSAGPDRAMWTADDLVIK